MKSGVDQDIASYVTRAAKNFAFLLSAFSVHLFIFSPTIFKRNVTLVANSEFDFNLLFDDVFFRLT